MKIIKIFLLVVIISLVFEVSSSISGTIYNSNTDYRWRPRHRIVIVHPRYVIRRPVVYVVRPRWHRRHFVRRYCFY